MYGGDHPMPQPANSKDKWEVLSITSDRLSVHRGWIVRTRLYVTYCDMECNKHKSDSIAVSQTFVPDPGHHWDLS